jgi:adenosine deaminase
VAINAVNPDRIGHGTHIIHDRAAVELARERGVTLEMCPWSNCSGVLRVMPKTKTWPS